MHLINNSLIDITILEPSWPKELTPVQILLGLALLVVFGSLVSAVGRMAFGFLSKCLILLLWRISDVIIEKLLEMVILFAIVTIGGYAWFGDMSHMLDKIFH